jgi:8-oxo-dGTP diphosphatase
MGVTPLNRLEKYAAIVIRAECLLAVRKLGPDSLLMLPGGKPSEGEQAESCLARELLEELSVSMTSSHYHMTIDTLSAGKVSVPMHIHLFVVEYCGHLRPSHEIIGFEWLPISSLATRTDVSSTIRETIPRILPQLRSGGGT